MERSRISSSQKVLLEKSIVKFSDKISLASLQKTFGEQVFIFYVWTAKMSFRWKTFVKQIDFYNIWKSFYVYCADLNATTVGAT